MPSLLDYLEGFESNPVYYTLIFFVFCVFAAIALPIPVETVLIIHPSSVPDPVLAATMGLGKGVGAMAVFFIGGKIESTVLRFARWGWFKWLLDKSEMFVRRFGYVALYVIMSIPLMVDTIPLYVFSILNKEGKLMSLRGFTIVNILAGTTRAGIVLILMNYFGVSLY